MVGRIIWRSKVTNLPKITLYIALEPLRKIIMVKSIAMKKNLWVDFSLGESSRAFIRLIDRFRRLRNLTSADFRSVRYFLWWSQKERSISVESCGSVEYSSPITRHQREQH